MRQTIQADVSHYAEDFLGEHDIKFGAQFTKGRSNTLNGYFQGYANFLYPYRWTQNVSYMQSWYGDTGLIFYNLHDAVNPFLTVGDVRLPGLLLRRPVEPDEAADRQPRPPLRPDDDEVRPRLRVRPADVADGHRQPDRPSHAGRHGQHLRLPDLVAPARPDLSADQGRQDRRPRQLRPLLPADHRRVPPALRPRRPARHPHLAMVQRPLGPGRPQR